MGEVNHAAAVVEHENNCREKKQKHQQVHDAEPLAARVLNIVHIFPNCVMAGGGCRETWGKSKQQWRLSDSEINLPRPQKINAPSQRFHAASRIELTGGDQTVSFIFKISLF